MKYWETHDGVAVECCGHALTLVVDECGVKAVSYNYSACDLSEDVGCGYERTGYVEEGVEDDGEILPIGDVDAAVFFKDTALGEMMCVAFADNGEWYLAAQLVDYGSGWYVLSVIGDDPDIEDIFDIDNGVIAKR